MNKTIGFDCYDEKNINDILQEFYEEYISVHGVKHAKRVEELLKEISLRIKYYPNYNSQKRAITGQIKEKDGNIKTAIRYYVFPINYFKNVLKHELWHVLECRTKTKSKKTDYIPSKYNQIIGEKSYISETEKWAEWFSKTTHKEDMDNNIKTYGMCYFTANLSSGSAYDSLINIADITSCLIPKEKILDAFLNSDDYETNVTFEKLYEEFDKKYENAISNEEKNKIKIFIFCNPNLYGNLDAIINSYDIIVQNYINKNIKNEEDIKYKETLINGVNELKKYLNEKRNQNSREQHDY